MKFEPMTLTVGELNEYVRKTLATDPMLRGLRLRGELSNFKRHSSGHWYFTLKDEQSAIQCAMFRQAASGVAFAPRDGQRVVLFGSVGLYVKTGQYQFYADGMQPDGVGALFERFERLKAKLQGEGLFDASLKKPLPLLPAGVGIVTSPTGAVLHDIMRVAWRRNPGMPLYLCSARVQGEGAAEEIARALARLDRFAGAEVIIVGRGGGSIEDLWPFNEEIVARAIAACRTPVVSAVGHETDFTIADFVADARAPTPSAAAELVVAERMALLAATQRTRERMTFACQAHVSGYAARLSQLCVRLQKTAPALRVQQLTARNAALRQRLETAFERAILAKRHALSEATLRLRAASPEATLQRGYAIVLSHQGIVQSANSAEIGDELLIRLRDGALMTTVHGKETGESIWPVR